MRIVRIFARLRGSGIVPGEQPVNTDIMALVKDIQDRVREVAYLMWESAGRHHGMAMEYWLSAEREVISTMQTAAERMMPGQAHPGDAPVETAPAIAPPVAEPAPAEPVSQASEEVVAKSAAVAETSEAAGASATAAKAAAKPTRKAGTRTKRTPPAS